MAITLYYMIIFGVVIYYFYQLIRLVLDYRRSELALFMPFCLAFFSVWFFIGNMIRERSIKIFIASVVIVLIPTIIVFSYSMVTIQSTS